MNTHTKKQLEDFYGNKKLKEYYSSNRIMELTGISERTFRYRVKELAEQYKDIPSLLHKKDRKWRIHYTLVDAFQSKYQPREFTLHNLNWKSFITWNTKHNYPEEYHQQLIKEIMDHYDTANFFSAVEKTRKGINHVHLVCDLPPLTITNKIEEVLERYIGKRHYVLEVTPVIKRSQSINYLKK